MPTTPRLSLTARRLVGGLAMLVAGLVVAVGAGPGGGAEPPSGGEATTSAAPPAGVGVLPRGGAADAEAGAATAPQRASASRSSRVHVVDRGQTPQGIAEQHGVGTRALTRANAHVDPTALPPGAQLVIPDPDAPRPRTPEEALAADLPLEQVIDELAGSYDVDPALVKAVAWVESRWDQHVVSDREAIGVMQVQPATGETVADQLGRPLVLHDLRDNVEAGVAYLDLLEQRYAGDRRAALAAYHQGPRAVEERGVLRVSDRYVDDVLRYREVFAGG